MLLKALAEGIAIFSILIVLIHIFIIKYSRLQIADPLRRKLIAGLVFGAAACCGIAMNALLFKGFLEGKYVLIAAAAIFYGRIPALIAGIISLAFILLFPMTSIDPVEFIIILIILIPMSYQFGRGLDPEDKTGTLAMLIPFSILASIVPVIVALLRRGEVPVAEALGYSSILLTLVPAAFVYGIGWLYLFEYDIQKKALHLRRNNDELSSLNEQLRAADEQLRAQFEDLLYSRAEMEKSEMKYRMLFESGSEGLWTCDPLTGETFFSDRFCSIADLDKNEKNMFAIDRSGHVHEAHLEKFKNAFTLLMDGKIDKLALDYPTRLRTGSYRWVRLRATSAKDRSGRVFWIVGSIQDIHSKRLQQEKLYQDLYFDPLTGLPNRRYLTEAVERAIAQEPDNHDLYIIQIDLDNFKLINDTFGHGFGDRLLQVLAGRLKKLQSPDVIIARSSGDEFALFLRNQRVRQSAIRDLLQSLFDASIALDESQLHITGSAGIVHYPEGGTTAETLLKNVDAAMYHAKRQGKGQYAYYSEEITSRNQALIAIEQGLRTALKREEFTLNYQPQFRAADRRIVGFEALLRWNSDALGSVPPDRFIPVAEETGLIVPIGSWAFREACLFSVRINTDPDRPLVVSVNFSIVQLLQDHFVESIRQAIAATGADPARIAVEITESQIMESLESNLEKLRQIRAMGLEVFLDDFGTGYSSLSYLMAIPASKLKIDKSFIASLETDAMRQSITRSIVEMASNIGMASIAEGVETEGQLEILKAMRCDCIQGYLLGRPVPAAEAVGFLL